MKFKQSNYFKKFVDFNTEKRKNAIIDFEKKIFKHKIFSKNFVAIHKIKAVLKLNKPIYVGFSILELRKLLMYDFHYGYFKNKFDAKLLFTDTDSLAYEIKGEEDVYEKFYLDKRLFDFSDYSQNSKYYDVVNKKSIGKMKDEFKGNVIIEFIGLKSKFYSLVSVNNEKRKRAKGINKKLKHREFVDVLFNKKIIRHNMKRI